MDLFLISFWLKTRPPFGSKTSLFLTHFDLFLSLFYSVNNGKMEPFYRFLGNHKKVIISAQMEVWLSL